MRKLLLLFIFTLCFFHTLISIAQTVEEKELFDLKYEGNADIYSFISDEKSGNYCYAYKVPGQEKFFLISRDGESEKYDYFFPFDVKFDSRGNYFAVAVNNVQDYGTDNNFLVVNGKTVKGLEFIETYSSFMNKSDEFVFVFKTGDKFYFGYAKADGSFRQSESYDNIKTMYNSVQERYYDGEDGNTSADYYYYNDKGERGFIIIKDGNAGLKFGDDVTMTEYSDINESSVTFNKNNELSFIAKTGGRFYEKAGNEFAVSGSKVYKSFDYVYPPLMFSSENIPLYSAGDSTGEYSKSVFFVSGSDKLPVNMLTGDEPVQFMDLYDIKVLPGGGYSYFAMQEVIVKAKSFDPGQYDNYFNKTYYVKDGNAFPLGYNIGKIVYDAEGNLIYSGIADLDKNENILMQSNGQSIIVIGQGDYNYIADYGITKDGVIYYFGQKIAEPEKDIIPAAGFYFGNELKDKFQYVTYQGVGNELSMLQMNPLNGGYAVCAEEIYRENIYKSYIVTDKGKLDFPANSQTGSGSFFRIGNMFYTKSGKLFYTGTTEVDTSVYYYTDEIYTDDRSLGKHYNFIKDLKYDSAKDEITFLAARKNKIYAVNIRY
ncbi:MAG: hypothetical protein IPM96_18130 [Ignavibacteria bacterium]|nr:hypothetical protein [Ignavibacteria bacterium]